MYVVWYILEFHNLAFNFFSFLRNQYLSGVKYISFDFFKYARVNLGRKGAESYNLLYDNVFTVEELWSGSKYINLSNSRLCISYFRTEKENWKMLIKVKVLFYFLEFKKIIYDVISSVRILNISMNNFVLIRVFFSTTDSDWKGGKL